MTMRDSSTPLGMTDLFNRAMCDQNSGRAENYVVTMKNNPIALILFIVALISSANCQTSVASSSDRDLESLAADFWTWRAKYAPFTGDDVNRIERPGGMRDWSRARIDNHRAELAEFEARWKKIEISGWPIPKQVDYRLIGSALSRVRWGRH